MLVEPSSILRSSFHDWLEQVFAGHRILIAANGEEGLKLAGQERPSHILIEMELPDMSGLEVLRLMRHALLSATIVATGWYQNSAFLHEVCAAGANGFIRKHKLPNELLPFWEGSLDKG